MLMYVAARGQGMRIIICDDNVRDAEQAKAIISRQLDRNTHEIRIKSPQDVYVAAEEDLLKCDIVVLGVKFKEENLDGIVLGALINKKLPACQIIYYTRVLEYAPVVYETRHCYFLLKQNMEQILPKAINKALETYTKVIDDEIIEVLSNGYKCFILQSKIMYIERVNRRINIYDEKKTYSCYMSLKQVEKKLNSDFVRCHGGYIVNLGQVMGVENLEISLKNGIKIPIGKSFDNQFKIRYLEYYKG